MLANLNYPYESTLTDMHPAALDQSNKPLPPTASKRITITRPNHKPLRLRFHYTLNPHPDGPPTWALSDIDTS